MQPGAALTLVLGKTAALWNQGNSKALGIEEALQVKTYQESVKGKPMAVLEVLHWILARETWIARNKSQKHNPIQFLGTRQDPDNADAELLRLGIATPDAKRAGTGHQRA